MRFFCFSHQKDFEVRSPGGRVYCDVGPHGLGLEFPGGGWEQCRHCETVWVAETGDRYRPTATCPSCALPRALTAVCAGCGTCLLDDPGEVGDALFGGGPSPSLAEQLICGVCAHRPAAEVLSHYCFKIERAFLAEEQQACPFGCGAGSFPTHVPEYLNGLKTKSQALVRIDVLDMYDVRFIPAGADEEGPFVLVQQNGAGIALVVPRYTLFEHEKSFAGSYSLVFDYDRGAGGDVLVHKPAVAELTGGAWRLIERGRLTFQEPVAVAAEERSEGVEQPTVNQPQPEVSEPLTLKSQAEPVHRQRAAQPVAEPPSDPVGAGTEVEHTHPVTVESKVWVPPHQASDAGTPVRLSRRGTYLILLVLAAVLCGYGVVSLVRVLFTQPTEVSNRNDNLRPTPTPMTTSVAAPEGMVLVKGDSFVMGRDGGDEYEHPAHAASVKSFYIDVHEVTCAQYAKFVAETKHPPPPTWPGGAYEPATALLPVTGVSWDDAQAYARWAGGRLPTEEEWEFAARGTDGRLYPWGNAWQPNAANAAQTSAGRMVPVGSYSAGASPSGAFDMVGNAWEWTASSLKAYPGGNLPQVPEADLRVIRGNYWNGKATQATTTFRRGYPARGEDYKNTGFRCARDAAAQ